MLETSPPQADALDLLFADLKALRTALEDEDHDAAAQLMTGHDLRLKQYCQSQDAYAAAPMLRELLLLQQSLMTQMFYLRDSAEARLRSGHQSVRAARAYYQAESLE